MAGRIIQGTVFDVLPTLKPGSVDCCVTSPPYWMLRSYLPKGHVLKPLELGSDKTPAEYVASMVRVFALVWDALADHGTCWANVGDSYAVSGGCSGKAWEGDTAPSLSRKQSTNTGTLATGRKPSSMDAGNLCLIPQRLAIALQDFGWIVRSVIVWHKPAPMPSSVSGWAWRRCRVKVEKTPKNSPRYHNRKTAIDNGVYPQTYDPTCVWSDCPGCKKCAATDGYILRKGSWRPTSSWEPILMLAKKPGYFCDGEAVKTPAASATVSRDQYTRIIDDPDEQFAVRHDHETICDGANLRDVWRADLDKLSKEELIALVMHGIDGEMPDVWRIASEPLREKHYAAFPSELVYRCLKAGTSANGYCVKCGGPVVRVIESEKSFESGSGRSGNAIHGKNGDGLQGGGDTGDVRKGPVVTTTTINWRPSCRCNAGTRPGLVLDPFAGSCRTGIEAQRLGLDFIGVELNPEYVEMGQRLLREACPLFVG